MPSAVALRDPLASLAATYRRALTDDVLPFWERHSRDREHGGYFTCLERDGTVFDTDKFVWLQGRQMWTFATAWQQVQPRDEWLETARRGARFLLDHGRDDRGDWYFALSREGRPLEQPWSIFSDCFAAMGLARFAVAAQDDEAAEAARTVDPSARVRSSGSTTGPGSTSRTPTTGSGSGTSTAAAGSC
jgi:N-acylglucosamine 2-epimerase